MVPLSAYIAPLGANGTAVPPIVTLVTMASASPCFTMTSLSWSPVISSPGAMTSALRTNFGGSGFIGSVVSSPSS